MNFFDPLALSGGSWVRRGPVFRWVPDDRFRAGRERKPDHYFWDLAAARRAHAAHVRGERGPWIVEGERVYQRNRKRRQRREERAG